MVSFINKMGLCRRWIKKNSQVFSAVAVPMSVAVVVVVVMVVAAGIMCFVANGGEGAADGLLPTPALIGTDREHAGLAGSDTLFRFESRVANLGRIRWDIRKKSYSASPTSVRALS